MLALQDRLSSRLAQLWDERRELRDLLLIALAAVGRYFIGPDFSLSDLSTV